MRTLKLPILFHSVCPVLCGQKDMETELFASAFPELIAFKFTQLSTYLLLDRSRCRCNIIIACFDTAKCSILGDTFYYMGS